jgi:hydrogenase expression/formation protein HypD
VKYVDEYREQTKAAALSEKIREITPLDSHYKIMEICGGHTHTIYKYGIESYLPDNIHLVHGPGCPVCVIPLGRVDDAIAISLQDVIFTCFGDMIRVPGNKRSLGDAKAQGADVRIVYSPLDALHIAEQNPSRQVVFLAIGFETTAPATAIALKRAKAMRISNFSVFCNHVTIIPPLVAILDSENVEIDAFIGPGHVAAVTGSRIFAQITETYATPVVVSGFEPLDVLQSVYMLVKQFHEGVRKVENQYSRVVSYGGNPVALRVMEETMEVRPYFEWRGLGTISNSGLKINSEYADFDAENRFSIPGTEVKEPRACQCGQVLQGKIKPYECKVFGKACTPEKPIGTCMVSAEGACAAYYNYGRFMEINAKLVKSTK